MNTAKIFSPGLELQVYARICGILGKVWEQRTAERRLEKVRAAIAEEYLKPQERFRRIRYQGHLVMLIVADIAEPETKKELLQRLAEIIAENRYRLDTGFVSVQYLMDVLSQNGYSDIARRLLFQREAPSWLYPVLQGATTIWENWKDRDARGEIVKASYNHYAYGCVGEWIYRQVGGIRPGKPGYKHIVFSPDIRMPLSYSHCRLKTPFGMTECHWERREGICHITVVIPRGTTADVEVESFCKKGLAWGEYTFEIVETDGIPQAEKLLFP